MDAVIGKYNRAVLTVIASAVKERKQGQFFLGSYIPTNDNGDKIVYPGMIVAVSGSYYVPYNVSASYGSGSDTAVGILNEVWDVTLFNKMISPVTEGTFYEKYCYEFGGTFGSIRAAVKTSLSHIQWK
jgi:hypothetical protein